MDMGDIIKESDFLLYWGEDGKVHAQVVLGDETVWVSQRAMSQLFDCSTDNISLHLKNIFNCGELEANSVTEEFSATASDGKVYKIKFYNLEAIIAVGYRVNSYKATKFRQWATRILKEYLIKGFVMDDERLKQGNRLFGKDYFRELLERIREIRASEKMFYEKIKEYYSTSVDYDKEDPKINLFFAQAQNKLEYAVIGKTSAEIIKTRVDASQPNLGLKTFKNIHRDGNILKTDIIVAKNYLTKEELSNLNLLVTMFLDYIENFIGRTHKVMKMVDWSDRLDAFLEFNEYQILKGHGKISKATAESFAEEEFKKYKLQQQQQPNNEFKEVLSGIVKKRELPKEPTIKGKGELSDFNKKLKKAAKLQLLKAKTKTCPNCGKELDINAEYCDNNLEIDGDIVPCGYGYAQ